MTASSTITSYTMYCPNISKVDPEDLDFEKPGKMAKLMGAGTY